ncbi:hypothetical protein Hypma_005082 [Hypsizygus marmoreus]|uniref:Uncharacterized protein n=1 Tax=Hypsizygus marmoreus TaxID=39966 RepID=A0A369K2X4_HYPMA|nr:hypothetical protein Hypma_005082 [Hypsizygus marmoreus]
MPYVSQLQDGHPSPMICLLFLDFAPNNPFGHHDQVLFRSFQVKRPTSAIMPSDIPADAAYIGGVWCEGVLYGIHIVLYGTLCKIFLNRSYIRGREVSSAILIAFSTCMFILSTAHVALAVNELLKGFVYQRDMDGGPPAFFRQNVFPERKAIYIINTLLGDSLLVWRVYVIWGRDWRICVPSVSLGYR